MRISAPWLGKKVPCSMGMRWKGVIPVTVMSKADQARKTCFVICPIGNEGSPTRLRSDQVQRHIISPAAKECGYEEVRRADQLHNPGIITSQIIQYLMDDDLVIADLTDHNPNVFYELAIRHVSRKPIVQLIRMEQHLPFDVSQMRTIPFDLTDPDKVLETRLKLVQQIRAAEENPSEADNPISAARELQILRQSSDPVTKGQVELLTLARDQMLQLTDASREQLERLQSQQHQATIRDREMLSAITTEMRSANDELRQEIESLMSYQSSFFGEREHVGAIMKELVELLRDQRDSKKGLFG